MTIIAWDGKTLAADRQSTQDRLIRTISKIRKYPNGSIAAFNGPSTNGCALLDWYGKGADPDKWPTCQSEDEWAELIVVNESGLFSYEQNPYPLKHESDFEAFGSGAQVALGAMAMGATAIRAVEIAAEFISTCGRGIESFNFESRQYHPPRTVLQTLINKAPPQC